jgi:hypothetical protein
LKHPLEKYVIVISLASIASFSLGSSEAFAHYGEQLSGYGTAEIDGIRSLGEWDDAFVIPLFGGKSEASKLLVMNDENNLYIALSVIDNTLGPRDQFGVRFDNSHNGIFDVNDDSGALAKLGFLNDGHFNGTNWIADSRIDGEGAAQNDGTRNFMEYSKPLKSGDVNDFNLSMGDTVGFCITYVRDGVTTDSMQYGPACRLLDNEQNLYGNILLVPFSVSWHGLMAMDADKRNVNYGETINFEGYLYGDTLIDEELVYITISETGIGEIILEQTLIPSSESVDYFENTAWPFTFKVGTSQIGFTDDMTYVVEAKYMDKSTKLNFLIKADTKTDLGEKAVDAGEAIVEAGTETGELIIEAGKEAGKVIVDAGGNVVEKGVIVGEVVTEKTTEGIEEIQEKGGGCLIATATYGSEFTPQVQQLRELRDNKLLQTESGSAFMKSFNEFYYSFSPEIADFERENPIFREAVKIAITPMISSLSILNYIDMDSEAEVLGYGISLILLNVGMYFAAPVIVIVGIKKKF